MRRSIRIPSIGPVLFLGACATIPNGPGVMVIFDVTDPAMAPAMTGVAVSAGTIHHVELTRLFTMEEVKGLREKANKIRGAYKPPGQ